MSDEIKLLYSVLVAIGTILYFCGVIGKDENDNTYKIFKAISLYVTIMPIFYMGLLNFVDIGVAIIIMIVITLLIMEAFNK